MNDEEPDIDKLKTDSIDLSKRSDLAKNDVLKTTSYDELVKKVNTIDSENKIWRKKIEDVDKKIPDANTFILTKESNWLKRLFKCHNGKVI